MPYLLHKISRANWGDGENEIPLDELNADAITKDLRTENNTSSWWIANSSDEFFDIGVSWFSTIKTKSAKFYFVCVPYDTIYETFKLVNSPQTATTAIVDMDKRHYDISELNYKNLGILAQLIEKAYVAKNVYSINNEEAIRKIKELYAEGRIYNKKLGDYAKGELNSN